MKIKQLIICFGIVATMLTGCTRTDNLALADDEVSVIVNAQIDNGMGARAAADDENSNVCRYVLEIYSVDATDNETLVATETNIVGTFAPKLDRKKNYRFYCWADEGDDSPYVVSGGLKSISMKAGMKPAIAHYGMSDIISGENPGEAVTINMSHAVAKLVIMTTQPLRAGAITAETSTYAACNAITRTGTGQTIQLISQAGPKYAIDDASPANPVEVLSMYVLAGGKATFAVTLRNSTLQDASRTFDNVPFAADCRTVLKGDVTSINAYNVTMTATLDTNWTDDRQ